MAEQTICELQINKKQKQNTFLADNRSKQTILNSFVPVQTFLFGVFQTSLVWLMR